MDGGFVLHPWQGDASAGDPAATVRVRFGEVASLPPQLRAEAAVHEAAYLRHPSFGSILPADDADTIALSRANIAARPLLDDFAQLVGTRMKTVFGAAGETADALERSSAVLVAGCGALCCGADRGEAEAVRMIVAKNATAYLWSALVGEVRPISRLDSLLMRVVYQRRYSREISRNVG